MSSTESTSGAGLDDGWDGELGDLANRPTRILDQSTHESGRSTVPSRPQRRGVARLPPIATYDGAGESESKRCASSLADLRSSSGSRSGSHERSHRRRRRRHHSRSPGLDDRAMRDFHQRSQEWRENWARMQAATPVAPAVPQSPYVSGYGQSGYVIPGYGQPRHTVSGYGYGFSGYGPTGFGPPTFLPPQPVTASRGPPSNTTPMLHLQPESLIEKERRLLEEARKRVEEIEEVKKLRDERIKLERRGREMQLEMEGRKAPSTPISRQVPARRDLIGSGPPLNAPKGPKASTIPAPLSFPTSSRPRFPRNPAWQATPARACGQTILQGESRDVIPSRMKRRMERNERYRRNKEARQQDKGREKEKEIEKEKAKEEEEEEEKRLLREGLKVPPASMIPPNTAVDAGARDGNIHEDRGEYQRRKRKEKTERWRKNKKAREQKQAIEEENKKEEKGEEGQKEIADRKEEGNGEGESGREEISAQKGAE
ncbi:MAG: hypothetical protein Q9167_001419 [Letrouitia subvulpina]